MARSNKNYEPQKEALARAAFDLFIAHGYENTTVTQIMRAAGLTKAGMYHYFSSKEEILDAAIDYGIAQDIAALREGMTGLSVEEKMLLFTRGNANPSELMGKVRRLKGSDNDSYAAYRIRERTLHADIPIMEELIREGVAAGVYETPHPRQVAEFVVLLAKAIAETNILPRATRAETVLRAQTFLHLVGEWLHPSPGHLAKLVALFEQELSTSPEGRDEDDAD